MHAYPRREYHLHSLVLHVLEGHVHRGTETRSSDDVIKGLPSLFPSIFHDFQAIIDPMKTLLAACRAFEN